MESLNILGVRVDNLSYDDAVGRVEFFLSGSTLRQIATVNPEFVVLAQKHPAFAQVLDASAMNVPDGVGLLWAARRVGKPLKERVTGQELVNRIARLAAERGERIYFLGARPGIAERAARRLESSHAGLQIAGCYAGSPSVSEETEIVERINRARARILLVAFGPPRQELWIARNAARLKVPVAMGVGGTFDTLAGIIPRAPNWIQRVGFEWAYRLLREPWRLRRQLAIPYFMWLVLTHKKK